MSIPHRNWRAFLFDFALSLWYNKTRIAAMERVDNMTKIDLITGILGSGKTTFIHEYASHLIQQGQRIAILENDFGAVNVDMVMLQDLKCENCQLEMIAGGGDPCLPERTA